MITRTTLVGDDGKKIATIVMIESAIEVVEKTVTGDDACASVFRQVKALSPLTHTVIVRYEQISGSVLLSNPPFNSTEEAHHGLSQIISDAVTA